MTEYRMLGEFVHHCAKCKLDLNHRITLMDGDMPARVLCLTCMSERNYHVPGKRSKREPGETRALSSQEVVRVRQNHEENEWKLKLADQTKTPVTYSASATFESDDHVYHPTFGLGLIVGFVGGDKVQIYFGDEGVKLLKGKKAPAPQGQPKLTSLLLR